MNVRDVAVATITMARNASEERLLLGALTRLAAVTMPVTVADGGSSQRFIDAMSRLPGVTVVPPHGDGLVAQVQASVRRAQAAQRRFVLYTEPDKREFFDRHVLAFIHQARARSAIVIASRSAKGFRTFPRFQRLTESAANELCRAVTRIRTDYFYGPFLFDSSLAPEVGRASRDLGWGWRPYLFARAHLLGHRIGFVTADFECPGDQRREDDRDKEHRARQLADNARGIVAAVHR